jgi:hypothetical protein
MFWVGAFCWIASALIMPALPFIQGYYKNYYYKRYATPFGKVDGKVC